MYLYPDEITAELIDVMKKCEKIAKYVDLPLQHISDKILKAMNRRGYKHGYQEDNKTV
jgi:ribosomal protein S12 methylthiotransferase